MENLIRDSALLLDMLNKSKDDLLNHDDIVIIDDFLNKNAEKKYLLDLYHGKYNFEVGNIVQMVKNLFWLQADKLNEILLIAKNCKIDPNIICFDIDIQMVYNNIILDTRITKYTLFCSAIQYGYVDLLKNIYTTEQINFQEDGYLFFIKAVSSNQLKVIIWMLSLDFDMNDCKEELFILACKKGNIEIVKYLLNQSGLKINLHYNEDQAFREACIHNQLEIVQLLISLGVNPENESFERNRYGKNIYSPEITSYLTNLKS